MIEFIDEVLGFYFDGGFDQMIEDAKLDQEEIFKWGSLAVLFRYCIGETSEFDAQRKENAFCLIESLYSKLEVDLMFGEIDKTSLEDILEGYDFNANEFEGAIEAGIELVEENGLNLYHLIKL